MTWLDVVCGLFLLLAGVGGYAQGLIRGAVRLIALLAACIFGLLVAMRLGPLASAAATGLSAGAATLFGVAAAALAAWGFSRTVPSFVHRSLTNRLLGIVPAILLGLVILAIGLGLVDRLAASPATQELVRKGLVTGPLVGAGDLIEQMAAGVR